MASFAKFVVVSILAATGFGDDLQAVDIITKGASVESKVARACMAEAAFGALAGPAGEAVAGTACTAQYAVVGTVIVAASIYEVGRWAGCDPWFSSNASKPRKPQIVAPPAMLREMKVDLHEVEIPFREMGLYMSNMTTCMNEEKWAEVAAYATMTLGAAAKFSFFMQQALYEGGCDQPPPKVTCPKHYYLLNHGDTKTCQNQPLDCYVACCREQDTWCDGESQCKLARGCGPTLTPAPSFREVNCKDLEVTRGDFGEATTSLHALHSCASQLSKGVKSNNGCSKNVEQKVRAQIESEFAQVNKDLDTLTKLYYKEATPSLATALLDKRSSLPSNLVALDNAPWQQSYARVSSSCDSMKRKVDVWLECKGSTAAGKMLVGEMPIHLFLIVLLLLVGCYVYFRFIDSARRESDTEMEYHLLEAAGRPVEKARPKVFVTFLVVYTLLIGFVALLVPRPIRQPANTSASTGTDALCQQKFQHAQTMFDVCDDFAFALKSGTESDEVGLDQLLSVTVAHMAAIDKYMMPK